VRKGVDARYVAYDSAATNLGPGDDANGQARHLQMGPTSRHMASCQAGASDREGGNDDHC